ncbi:MAG: hypothetical protein FD174_3508 [Geobacteraceae bacterium]|nr:MAG: hypothetical protein FD174_3508 [Geobacteraceae bacterium]
MTAVSLSRGKFFLLQLAVAAALALLGLTGGRGALLVSLVFWTALAQGSVAVVAVTDLTGASWTGPLRSELLAAVTMLPLLAALFLLLLWPSLDLYSWAAAPTAWLNRPFFLTRNLALLAAAATAACLFACRSLRQDPARVRFAVAYLFLFVACQSLVAFDWVMSLAYPWVSSMLGAYFFVEALYAGLALAGMLAFLLDRQRREAEADWPAARRDLGMLLFGFSILWGGLFFAQFLLLWYGNIPEEVQFVVERVSASPSRELCAFFLAACFAVPFLILLSARAKRNAGILGAVSLAVLLGMLAEKLVFVLPAVPVRFGVLLAENALLLAVWLLAVQSRERLLPEVGGKAEDRKTGRQ